MRIPSVSAVSFRSVWRNRRGTHIGVSLANRILYMILVILAIWNPSGFSVGEWIVRSMASGQVSPFWFFQILLALILGGSVAFALARALYRFHWGLLVGVGIAVLTALGLLGTATGWNIGTVLSGTTWLFLLGIGVFLGLALSKNELKNLDRRLKPKVLVVR